MGSWIRTNQSPVAIAKVTAQIDSTRAQGTVDCGDQSKANISFLEDFLILRVDVIQVDNPSSRLVNPVGHQILKVLGN